MATAAGYGAGFGTSTIGGHPRGLAYLAFTPILGGWIADRFLGAKRTVVLGALLMSAGHLAMSFDQSFLIALGLLILGSGCLKGNISAQVGALYPNEAQSLRDRGFTIFSTGINIGAVIGPLATGGVAAVYGWHAGFGLAAGLMLVALAVYLAGQRHFPESRRPGSAGVMHRALTGAERRTVWALLGVIALSIPAGTAYSMIWSIGILWVDAHVALGTPWGAVPSSWFGSVDSFGSIIAAPLLVALWAWQARSGSEPHSLTKIGIGLAIIGIGALLLAAGNLAAATPDSVPVGWALAGYLGMGAGFMYYWPVTLALVSKTAPPRLSATLMGAAFLSPFLGHTAMGWVGSFYDQMQPAVFWTLDAAIALAGAVLVFVVRCPLERALEPIPDRG